MITFSQFCERLARGQLKSTSAVDETISRGEIVPEFMDTVLSLTNEGLIDLSTRLPIISRQIDLVFQDGKTMYALDETGVGDYLDDAETQEFIPEDFVRVLDIWDEYGESHPHDTNGHIMTPSFNTLRFTKAKMTDLGEKVRIRYQSKHQGIDEDANIDLPPNLITALQLFVASLYISHMGGEEHGSTGDKYYGAYLRHIGEDEMRNLSQTSEVEEDTRLSDRGFV